MGDVIALSVEQLNREMIDALEFVDPVIADMSIDHPRVFFNLISRGAYKDGEGLVRKMHRFFGPVGDQAGLKNWATIRTGQEANGEQEAFDSCNYEAELINWGTQTIEYTGYGTNKRTKDFCVNDWKWTWEWRQQLRLIYNSLGAVALTVWENLAQEIYMWMCSQADRFFVMGNGSPDGIPLSVAYNPFQTTQLVIPASAVSTLNWDWMQWWHQTLSLDASKGKVGTDGDMPLFGAMIHPLDFKGMIMRDPELREDYRYADPGILIENYGKVRRFQGYAMMNHVLPPRYKIIDWDDTADTLTLERVVPYTEEAVTIGVRPTLNPDYINAEFAVGMIFLKDVFRLLVPSTVASPAPGFSFGAVPSLNGELKWLNILDRANNPLGEKGFFFGRYQAFVEPGNQEEYPIAFVYRRCVNIEAKPCGICGDAAAEADAWITITAAAADPLDGETDALHTRVLITLESCAGCEPPAAISVSYAGDGTADINAFLVSAGEAPKYQIIFDDPDDYVAAGTIVAGTSKISCGAAAEGDIRGEPK